MHRHIIKAQKKIDCQTEDYGLYVGRRNKQESEVKKEKFFDSYCTVSNLIRLIQM